MWTEIEAEFTDTKGNKLFVTVGGNVDGNDVSDMTFTCNGIDLTCILEDSEGDYMEDLIRECHENRMDAMYERSRD